METIRANLYDYPKYYDVLFGSDWRAEYDFLQACFKRFARGRVRRIFEPACGTGRLLVRFALAGYEVTGVDINPKVVAYCNARFQRRGLQPAAVVGDMADFHLPRKVDAAFNTINSFRHLPTEEAARSHLECIARALRRGGLYVLGLHLTPAGKPQCQQESWSARRGHLAVTSRMWTIALDRGRRRERVGLQFDIWTPRRQVRLYNEVVFRTYTQQQMTKLLRVVGSLEVVQTYDFSYQIDCPIQVDPRTEDVVYVLQRR